MAMKPVVKFVIGDEGCTAWKVRRMLAFAGTAHVALRYCLAAQRDEKNGFPFTAAMEWHKAADLFFPIGPLADLCWRKWESIVKLPRYLAAPITDRVQCDARTSRPYDPASPGNDLTLLTAA